MTHVLTLIAADGGLDEATAKGVADAMRDLGADTLSPFWLAPGRAADLPFGLLSPDQAEAAARYRLKGQAVDVVAQAVDGRRKKLLMADMDSTMVQGETLDELADFAGLKAEIAAVTASAMNGEIDFAESFRRRVDRLAGLSADHLEESFQRTRLMPGGTTLVATMKADGAFTVLVSGGISFFTRQVAAACGFDRDYGNAVEITNGRLTGRVVEPILDRAGKGRHLASVAAERHLPLAHALTVGDGANDLDMLKAAGLGVAFHAKPAVAAEARARIDHCDLTALLFAQGYREDEFRG